MSRVSLSLIQSYLNLKDLVSFQTEAGFGKGGNWKLCLKRSVKDEIIAKNALMMFYLNIKKDIYNGW